MARRAKANGPAPEDAGPRKAAFAPGSCRAPDRYRTTLTRVLTERPPCVSLTA